MVQGGMNCHVACRVLSTKTCRAVLGGAQHCARQERDRNATRFVLRRDNNATRHATRNTTRQTGGVLEPPVLSCCDLFGDQLGGMA